MKIVSRSLDKYTARIESERIFNEGVAIRTSPGEVLRQETCSFIF